MNVCFDLFWVAGKLVGLGLCAYYERNNECEHSRHFQRRYTGQVILFSFIHLYLSACIYIRKKCEHVAFTDELYMFSFTLNFIVKIRHKSRQDYGLASGKRQHTRYHR